MKRLAFISLSLFCALGFSQPINVASAEASLSYYAKVLSSKTYFYNSPNENAKLFEIPSSYFVLLTGNAGDDFYIAKYGDCLGYVKKSEVTPMDGVPSTPYANDYTFRITSMSGLTLMKSATFESETLLNIDFLEDEIYFYGNLKGQEFFSNSTNIWHYCSYSNGNQTYFGYLFSYYCDFKTKVAQNNEYFEEITETLVFNPEPPANASASDTITAIIVLAIAIPLLIVCYFIITPHRKKKPRTKVARRNRDYYELSESDLN